MVFLNAMYVPADAGVWIVLGGSLLIIAATELVGTVRLPSWARVRPKEVHNFPLKVDPKLETPRWGFIAAVAGVVIIAFAAALLAPIPRWQLPQLPTKSPAEPAPFPAGVFRCRVSYVNDGDTLRCADGTRVRLHAVAARESDGTCSPGHPCPQASAGAATAQLRSLVSGQTITCQKTGVSYERVTAICHNELGVEVNCAMVESGAALVWPRFHQQRPICRS